MGLLQDAIKVYENRGAAAFFNELVQFPQYKINRIYWISKYGNGASVLQYDWDNLVLLDACRYDEFIKLANFDNKRINSRITLGSRTPEFLRKTFASETLHDTVYITANPQVLRFETEHSPQKPTFHSIVSLLDRWDRNTQTILPKEVRQAAINTQDEYPNKKLIVHFLQPHAPFIGQKAAEIRARTDRTIGGVDPGREYTDVERKEIDTLSYEEALTSDDIDISREEIITAYRETLSITLEEIETLLKGLEGRTILTADHGELLGERVFPFLSRLWEHPSRVRSTELYKIPLVVSTTGQRKTIITETPEKTAQFNNDKIVNRLKSLGYTGL